MEKKRIDKITEAIWCGVKAVAKEPQDDQDAMIKFGLGASTVRHIRRTASYTEYQKRYMGNHDKKKSCDFDLDLDATIINLDEERAKNTVDEIISTRRSIYKVGSEIMDHAELLQKIVVRLLVTVVALEIVIMGVILILWNK